MAKNTAILRNSIDIAIFAEVIANELTSEDRRRLCVERILELANDNVNLITGYTPAQATHSSTAGVSPELQDLIPRKRRKRRSSRRRNLLTEEDKHTMAALYEEGKTKYWIAKKYGYSPSYVGRIIERKRAEVAGH